MTTAIVRGSALAAGLLLTIPPAQDGDAIRVCVGTDRVVRHESGVTCPPGDTEYLLARARPTTAPSAGDKASADQAMAQIGDLQRRIAFLTQRLATVEEASLGRGKVVEAPFAVVDGGGRPIFEIRDEPRGFRILNRNGQAVAFASALEGGGFFKGTSPDAQLQSTIGVDGQVAMVRVRKGGKVFGSFGLLEHGKAAVELVNDQGVGVVSLMPGTHGGGRLQLGNAAGNAMVEAGVTEKGVGLVRTFPLGNPGAGLLGMPGTFIAGRQK